MPARNASMYFPFAFLCFFSHVIISAALKHISSSVFSLIFFSFWYCTCHHHSSSKPLTVPFYPSLPCTIPLAWNLNVKKAHGLCGPLYCFHLYFLPFLHASLSPASCFLFISSFLQVFSGLFVPFLFLPVQSIPPVFSCFLLPDIPVFFSCFLPLFPLYPLPGVPSFLCMR